MSRLKKKLRSHKAGLPYGALVHIGEIKTQAPSLSLIAFSLGTFSEYELSDLPNLAALGAITRGADVRWLNVCASAGNRARR